MSVITIAREFGTWTSADSQELARRLNATLLTKEELEKRLRDAGMKSKLFQRYDERKPGFFSAFSPDQDIYLLYLKTVLLQAAQKGNTIILGRGAHLLLADLPNCLRLRLVAPCEFRLKNIQREFGYDEETANRLLHKCDADRAGFCSFHFNESWDDTTLYDLTINTATLDTPKLFQLIESQLNSRIGEAEEARAQQAIRNRLLAQKVTSALIVDQKLSLAFLEVEADDDGNVTLLGATTTPAAAHLVEKAAAAVEGVKSVNNKIRIAVEIAQNAATRL